MGKSRFLIVGPVLLLSASAAVAADDLDWLLSEPGTPAPAEPAQPSPAEAPAPTEIAAAPEPPPESAPAPETLPTIPVAERPAAQPAAAAARKPKAGRMLEEIVVTARRREESLQETPVAVSALGAAALAEAGVSTITDLQQVVPGLQFGESASKTPAIFIRGVGQREPSAELDPGVGVYLNGIFIARQDSQLLDTVDTQDIQVLRGPQGTLFGKNNTGGAMLVTTAAPNLSEYGWGASAKVGNFGRQDLKLSANIPLVAEELGLRLAVNRRSYDGFMVNEPDGPAFGDESRLAATARLLWQASDSLTADTFLYWSHQDERSSAVSCLFQNAEANVAQLHFPGRPDYEPACRESEAAYAKRRVSINADESVVRMDSVMAAVTLVWQLGEVQLKSISAWSRQYDIERNDDMDGTSVNILSTGSLALNDSLRRSGLPTPAEEREQISEELQINGNLFEDRLHYTTGLFLSLETMDNNPFGATVGPKGLSGIDPSTLTDAAIPGLPNLGGAVVFPLATFLATRSDLENKSAAIFAQGTWDMSEAWQLTLGARYTVEDRSRVLDAFEVDSVAYGLRIGAVYLQPLGFYSPIPRAQFDALGDNVPDLPLIERDAADTKKQKWKNFTPSATLSFTPSQEWLGRLKLDSGLFYFTYSEGFKAGGFSPRGFELVPFEPEEVTNFELGMKLDGLDSRLRFNASIYSMDYRNIQLRVAEQGARISDIYLFMSNAGAATINGAELETTVLLGNLTVFGNVNYTDAGYDEFQGQIVIPGQGASTVDRSAEPFGLVPELSYGAGLQYNWETGVGMFMPRLQMYYRSELFTGLDYRAVEFPSSTIGDLTLWNARLTWAMGPKLRVAGFVNNLTDEHYFKSGFAVSASTGAATLVQGEARTYGLELSWDF